MPTTNPISKSIRDAGLAAVCAVLVWTAAASAQQPTAPSAAAAPTAAAAPPAEGTRGGWRDACRRDIFSTCRRVSGGKAKRQCLDANMDKLAPSCRTALDERRQSRALARQNCRADIQKLCATSTSGGAQLQCLQQKRGEVSAACDTALTAMMQAAGAKKAEPKADRPAAAKK